MKSILNEIKHKKSISIIYIFFENFAYAMIKIFKKTKTKIEEEEYIHCDIVIL